MKPRPTPGPRTGGADVLPTAAIIPGAAATPDRRSRPSRRHSRPSRNYDYRDRYDDRYDGRYDGRYNEGWHREAGDRLRDTFNDALGGFRPDRY